MNAVTPLPSPVQLPRIVAICGNPKAGKSEVQKILAERFGYQPVDDGAVIRRFAIDYLGLTEDQVYTQEGKASHVEILGKSWQVRDILGTYGNKIEEMFGPLGIPMMATQKLPAGGLYSFGSCRRNQGAHYKTQGGIVLEIVNPLAGPSPYEFDRYDESLVDHTIENDALARGLESVAARLDLTMKVIRALHQLGAPA